MQFSAAPVQSILQPPVMSSFPRAHLQPSNSQLSSAPQSPTTPQSLNTSQSLSIPHTTQPSTPHSLNTSQLISTPQERNHEYFKRRQIERVGEFEIGYR